MIRNRRRNAEFHFARQLARSHSLVGMEDLRVRGMKASARGTVERPGKEVSAKRGLNRGIHRAAWGELQAAIRSACEMGGASWALVNARNTSIICSACECKDRRNRESQASFVCVSCGLAINADCNAALNIERRAVNLLGGFMRSRGIIPDPRRAGGSSQTQAGFASKGADWRLSVRKHANLGLREFAI